MTKTQLFKRLGLIAFMGTAMALTACGGDAGAPNTGGVTIPGGGGGGTTETAGGGSTGACTSSATSACYNFTDSSIVGAAGAVGADVIDDPDNATNKALQIAFEANAETWAGAVVTGSPINLSDSKIVTLRAKCPAAGKKVYLEFQNADNTKKFSKVATCAGTTWETLSFDFTGTTQEAGVSYAKALISPDWDGAATAKTGAGIFLFDELTYPIGDAVAPPPATAPTTAAPTPTKADADVVSMFSDVYTAPAAVDTPGWGQTTVLTTEPIAGNNTFKLVNTNFQGITFPDAGVDVSAMTNLHMDVWSATAGTLQVKLVSLAGGTAESPLVSFNVNAGTWTSIDLPMTGFTGLDKTKFAQLVLDQGGGKTYYLDNVYFWKAAATTTPPAGGPTTAAPPPTRVAADVKSIFSDSYANLAVAAWGPDWGPSSARINDYSISGNALKEMDLLQGQVFAGISFKASKFDATSFTHFSVDYFIPSPLAAGQVLNIKLSNHDGADSETGAIESPTQTTLVAGSWQTLQIPLSSFTVAANNLSRNNIAEIIITAARAGDVPTKIYFDNMYFYK